MHRAGQLHVVSSLQSNPDPQRVARPPCRYQDAAAVRDRLNLLQARLAELDAAGADRAPPPQRALRLGQRVVHAEHGYRGVVFGCAGLPIVCDRRKRFSCSRRVSARCEQLFKSLAMRSRSTQIANARRCELAFETA